MSMNKNIEAFKNKLTTMKDVEIDALNKFNDELEFNTKKFESLMKKYNISINDLKAINGLHYFKQTIDEAKYEYVYSMKTKDWVDLFTSSSNFKYISNLKELSAVCCSDDDPSFPFFTSKLKTIRDQIKIFNELNKSSFIDLTEGGRPAFPFPYHGQKLFVHNLPSFYQIIIWHPHLVLNPVIASTFGPCSIECNFRPIIVRQDGLAIVEILNISSFSVICAPPNHGISGHSIETINTCFQALSYSSYCLIDLSKTENIYYQTVNEEKSMDERLTIENLYDNRANKFDFTTFNFSTAYNMAYLYDAVPDC